MTPEPAHYGDELQDLLDKRLNANVRRAVERAEDRVRALVAYRNSAGRLLVCGMFEGGPVDLPVDGMVRERNGVRFRVLSAGDLSAVFWLEGPVVYSIVAQAEPEPLLLLAATLARK